MPNTENTRCEEQLQATVIHANIDTANLQLSATEQKSCATCADGGGCQSVSVYHWFFEKKSVSLPQRSDNPYQTGEELAVTFPEQLLQHAIWWLIGLPLAGFLIGIATTPIIGELIAFGLAVLLASAAFVFVRKRLQKRLAHSISITRH